MGSGASKADGQAVNNSNSGAQIAGADKGQSAQQQEKVLITGDDILIEYVDRLMNQLKVMGDESLLQD